MTVKSLNLFTSSTAQVNTSCGNLYVTIIYSHEGKIHKIIPFLGKSGNCPRAFLGSYGELISQIVQNEPQAIVNLTAASGHKCNSNSLCCVDALNRYIIDVLEGKIRDSEGGEDA